MQKNEKICNIKAQMKKASEAKQSVGQNILKAKEGNLILKEGSIQLNDITLLKIM